MLIFPSWVSHQVMPTPGTDRRIAVGFNLPGEWEGTADVGTTYVNLCEVVLPTLYCITPACWYVNLCEVMS